MYWITGLVGLASMVAPFVLNYTDNTSALWSSLGIGAALVVASVLEGVERDRDMLEYWAAGLLGLVAIVSPFLFGFSDHTTELWTSVIVGIVAVLAVGARIMTKQTG